MAALALTFTGRVGAQPATTLARPGSFDEVIQNTSGELFRQGQQIFRFDTFGDERFWSDTLRLHQAVAGASNGGVGNGVGPAAALAAGLKVDVDMVPQSVLAGIQSGAVNLNDPANTLALINAKAVLGVMPASNGRVGFTCALCHSTVDDSFAPGIGSRLDGWPNRDLNVGAIVAMAPDLSAVASLLQVDQATVRNVLMSWGPGKFDAELFLDGKAFRPDGKTAATLIPPAYGLAGVNLHTYTGWGSVPYWNAFVANLELRGSGVFYDPRLNDATKFPVAARAGLGNVRPAAAPTTASRRDCRPCSITNSQFQRPLRPREASFSVRQSRARHFSTDAHAARPVTCRRCSRNRAGACTPPKKSASTIFKPGGRRTIAIARHHSRVRGRARKAAITMTAASRRYAQSWNTTIACSASG